MGILIEKSGDRRGYERSQVSFYVFSRSTAKVFGKAKNLSEGGMFVETDEHYKPGSKLILELDISESSMPVKVYCEAVRSEKNDSGQTGVRIKFVNVFESDRTKIRRYLKSNINKINSDNYSLADFTDVPDSDLFKKADDFWQYGVDMQQKGYIRYRRPLASPSANRVMVEDDISGSKRECLSSSGHNVMTAGSVESAIGLIKQNHFDIIFLDLSMPKRDGLQILKDISLIDPNSTIVIISARPEEQLPGEITEAGAYNIIKKPFSVDQIQEAVAKVLGAEAMSS